ncbi:MAG: hypothetical protein WBP60_05655 [Gammaproteobacteria bacterium]
MGHVRPQNLLRVSIPGPDRPEPAKAAYFFLLAAFLRGAAFFFATGFLAAVFRVAGFFFAAGFLAAALRVAGFFFAEDFLAVAFFAAAFFAAAFFLLAIFFLTLATSFLISASTSCAFLASALRAFEARALTAGISFLTRRPRSLAPFSSAFSIATSFCFTVAFFLEVALLEVAFLVFDFFLGLAFFAAGFLVAIVVSDWGFARTGYSAKSSPWPLKNHATVRDLYRVCQISRPEGSRRF